MKKLNISMIRNDSGGFRTESITVEDVVRLNNRQHFAELLNHLMRDGREIPNVEWHDGKPHTLLIADQDSGDGILVVSDGVQTALQTEFVPNALDLLRLKAYTPSEQQFRKAVTQVAQEIAAAVKDGRNRFDSAELLEQELGCELFEIQQSALIETLYANHKIAQVTEMMNGCLQVIPEVDYDQT